MALAGPAQGLPPALAGMLPGGFPPAMLPPGFPLGMLPRGSPNISPSGPRPPGAAFFNATPPRPDVAPHLRAANEPNGARRPPS